MARIFNFSAGPAALPETVLKQAADELLDWRIAVAKFEGARQQAGGR